MDLSTFKDLKKETVTDLDGSIAKVEWSPDGHVLCASTKRGQVATYLARMPLVHGACGDTVAYLSSLREITLVKSGTPEDDQNVIIPVGLEPSYLAVGPKHVGVGMNNAALFYDISTKEEVHKEGVQRTRLADVDLGVSLRRPVRRPGHAAPLMGLGVERSQIGIRETTWAIK